jgi:hypothetical protein
MVFVVADLEGDFLLDVFVRHGEVGVRGQVYIRD